MWACYKTQIRSKFVGSYVSGLLIDTWVVALLGLRSHSDLITCKVKIDR